MYADKKIVDGDVILTYGRSADGERGLVTHEPLEWAIRLSPLGFLRKVPKCVMPAAQSLWYLRINAWAGLCVLNFGLIQRRVKSQ